jgi:hypothetical protein
MEKMALVFHVRVMSNAWSYRLAVCNTNADITPEMHIRSSTPDHLWYRKRHRFNVSADPLAWVTLTGIHSKLASMQSISFLVCTAGTLILSPSLMLMWMTKGDSSW